MKTGNRRPLRLRVRGRWPLATAKAAANEAQARCEAKLKRTAWLLSGAMAAALQKHKA